MATDSKEAMGTMDLENLVPKKHMKKSKMKTLQPKKDNTDVYSERLNYGKLHDRERVKNRDYTRLLN